MRRESHQGDKEKDRHRDIQTPVQSECGKIETRLERVEARERQRWGGRVPGKTKSQKQRQTDGIRARHAKRERER